MQHEVRVQAGARRSHGARAQEERRGRAARNARWREEALTGAFDLLVIGSGSAGTGAALAARQAGARRVAVVERDAIGGNCPSRACVPTKALLQSVQRLRIARESARFGVRAEAHLDWGVAMRRKDEIVREIVEHDERLYEGHLAGQNAFARHARAVDLDGIPRITFSDPPLAGVGLGEAEARQRGLDPVVARVSLDGMGRALVEGWEGGMVALVAERGTGRLLGASMWGPQADAVIHEVAALVRARATVRQLGHTIHAYPSYSEILGEAALALAELSSRRAVA